MTKFVNRYYTIVSSDHADNASLVLRQQFMVRTFVYSTIRYTVLTSFRYGVYTFSRTYWRFPSQALHYLVQDYVTRFQVYFTVFSSEIVVYTLIIMLQQNIVIQKIYGVDTGSLLWDVLIQVSQVMCHTIPDLYCKILCPAASDSVNVDLAFTVIQKHSLDLISPDFFRNSNPIDLGAIIHSVYQNTLPSDFHVQRLQNLDGFSMLEIEKFIGTCFDANVGEILAAKKSLPINYPKLNKKSCILIYMLGMSLFRLRTENCQSLSNCIVPMIEVPVEESIFFVDPALF